MHVVMLLPLLHLASRAVDPEIIPNPPAARYLRAFRHLFGRWYTYPRSP